MDRRVLAALHQARWRDRDADEGGIEVAEVRQHGLADARVGVVRRLRQAATDGPAGRLVTAGLQAASADVGGFLSGMADLDCGEAEAEELHAHHAKREEERHDHGKFRAHLSPRSPPHAISIGQRDCEIRYVSSRSMPDSATRARTSRRGWARAATVKAAATRLAMFSASPADRAWMIARVSPAATRSPIF